MSTPSADDQSSSSRLQHLQTLPLWPDKRPQGTPPSLALAVHERSASLFLPDRALTGIVEPSLTVWQPHRPNGTAVILAPGGGYRRIAIDKEGRDIAQVLASQGISVFLLTYRLPGEGHALGAEAPIADGQRAVRLLRHHAPEWQLDPERIGFLGFSAGGHLGASLATRFDRSAYALTDEIDKSSARPDFTALIYPVISMQDDIGHEGSRQALLGTGAGQADRNTWSAEQQVHCDVPEVFLLAADDDEAVSPLNAMRFYSALHTAGVKTELHIFRDGGHGFALAREPELPARCWPELFKEWMVRIGMMAPEGQ